MDSTVVSPIKKYEFKTEGSAKRIRIRTRQTRFIGIVFLTIGIIFAIFCGIALNMAIEGMEPEIKYFAVGISLIFPMTPITLGLGILSYTMDILLDSKWLVIRKRIFGIKFAKTYSRSEVKHFGIVEALSIVGHSINSYSSLAFDYGIETIEFATGIAKAEATAIVDACHTSQGI